MGGVLRPNRAASVFVGARSVGKLYLNGEAIWQSPALSTTRYEPVRANEDVLLAGSSTLAGLVENLWSAFTPPSQHQWYPLFRDNYTGEFNTTVGGVTLPGTGSALTLGRVPLAQILQNAQNNAYPAAVNPLTALGNYDALVMDGSDSYTAWGDHPILFNRYARTQLAYDWDYNPFEINRELDARMRLIRLAHAAGVRRVFLSVPWTRLLEPANDSRDGEWRDNCFQNMEEGFNWQQDRLNYQIMREGLGSYVSLVPFNSLIRRIYDDIESGAAPAGLSHIRMLFSNGDQTGDALDVLLSKHGYMLNFYGTYATNCLFHRVVYGTDPRGMSNTSANGLTVPQEVATYFQNIAVELADHPRSGRASGPAGYSMPVISEGAPADFISPEKLVHHQAAPLTAADPALPFAQPAGVAQMIVAFSFDYSQITSDEQYLFSCRAGTSDTRSFLSLQQAGEIFLMRAGNENQSGRSSVVSWVNSLVARGDGHAIIIADVIPSSGAVDKYGFNNSVRVIDTSASMVDEWADPPRLMLGRHNADARPVTVDSFTVELEGATVLDAIVSSELLSDTERFDYYRYLSKKLQVSVWEDLFPDLEI